MFGRDFLERHTGPKPLSIPFNAAVMTMANLANPKGWDVSDLAPSSLNGLTLHVRQAGRVVVWSGASDNTIFGDPEHNYAFRAWHDAMHYALQLDFSIAGEAGVAFAQCSDLLDKYGLDDETTEFCAIILAEIIGSAHWFQLMGEFPADQVKYFNSVIGAYRRLAQRVIAEGYREDKPGNRLSMLSLARKMYGAG
ncbi:hypothetical protein [Caulobacter phage KSC]|uniref:Uncharacterized protein n=1 Tax=Caulobacter phage KSC TaxID=3020398 RepID=A0AAF0B832_9CAUD|nr:hypothetical protein [Caulobacter phage KSC]